jgi:hypothetical protein
MKPPVTIRSSYSSVQQYTLNTRENIMRGYIIYHPKRQKSTFGDTVVYHDYKGGNQDPYVWNKSFLHTYCHITQMSPQPGDINFWVSGDSFPNFSVLYCDLVFVVKEKIWWQNSNSIEQDDPIVDSPEAYSDHYKWHYQHYLKKLKRFTLKADPEKSFQPQDSNKELLEITQFLAEKNITLDTLRKGMKAGFNSKPHLIGDITSELYEYLNTTASIKLTGDRFEAIRKNS